MTDTQVKKVRVLRRRGHSIYKIGIGLGLEPEDVRSCLFPVVPEPRKVAQVAKAEGQSNVSIAKDLGVHEKTVRNWLADHVCDDCGVAVPVGDSYCANCKPKFPAKPDAEDAFERLYGIKVAA